MTQVEIARKLDTTQARVSQICKLLEAEGLRRAELEQPDQRALIIDLYVRHHRPQVINESLWYSIDPPLEQVAKAAKLLRSKRAKVAVSADAAPDFLAPWRTPTLTVLYTNKEAALGSAGFVPALARGEASLIVRHVSDRSLLEPWPVRSDVSPFPLIHPLQQIWDLRDLGGEDRTEAADRLMRRIIMTRDEIEQ